MEEQLNGAVNNMISADAIIFDKDGTLIDFDAFWVTISVKAINDILSSLGREDIPTDEILSAYGVHNGITDIEGILCRGTYRQMGEILCDILNKYNCNISCDEAVKRVIDAYNRSSDAGEIKPTCPDLAKVLAELKRQGKLLAVVTTDNELITHKCLRELGIFDMFDKIYTDNGQYPTKPDPFCVYDFCSHTGVARDRVVMVGDTLTDVKFAKNAGISVVGVAKTPENRATLAPHANAVVPAISSLPEILG